MTIPFQQIRAKLLTHKKVIILVSAVAIVLALVSGGTLFALSRNNNPEAILYAALADDADMSREVYGHEQTIETAAGVLATADGYSSPGGTYQSQINLQCKAKSANGSVAANFTFRQIKEQQYFRYDSVAFTEGDEAIDKQLNDFYKDSVVGKWVQADGADQQYLGLKEYGVYFGMLGAYSKKLGHKQITQMLKDNGVITISNMQDIKNDGKPALEYHLVVHKAAYERFIDSVEPRFAYKSTVLDNYFDGDTTEITVVVDKATKKESYAMYSVPNLCTVFMSLMDPDAADSMAKHVTTKGFSTPTNSAKKLSKPSEFITQGEFTRIFSPDGSESIQSGSSTI